MTKAQRTLIKPTLSYKIAIDANKVGQALAMYVKNLMV
jgi:hypothetical protein